MFFLLPVPLWFVVAWFTFEAVLWLAAGSDDDDYAPPSKNTPTRKSRQWWWGCRKVQA